MEYVYDHKIMYTDLELHFLSQCYEGERIRVYKKQEDQQYFIACVHEDGNIAAAGYLKMKAVP